MYIVANSVGTRRVVSLRGVASHRTSCDAVSKTVSENDSRVPAMSGRRNDGWILTLASELASRDLPIGIFLLHFLFLFNCLNYNCGYTQMITIETLCSVRKFVVSLKTHSKKKKKKILAKCVALQSRKSDLDLSRTSCKRNSEQRYCELKLFVQSAEAPAATVASAGSLR